MTDALKLTLAPTHDPAIILQRLDRVLDPELDQSILKLGFVKAVSGERGHLTVALQMPTAWCSPNFAYMMAEDVRRELLAIESVEDVTIRLPDNVMSGLIEAGINRGQSFVDAFDEAAAQGETGGDLRLLRALFLRKGFIKRQEVLLRRLVDAQVSFAEISTLCINALSYTEDACLIHTQGGQVVRIEPAALMQDYLKRRAEIGIDCQPDALLFVGPRGEPIPADQLEKHLIYARTLRVSLEANGALCSALLEARR